MVSNVRRRLDRGAGRDARHAAADPARAVAGRERWTADLPARPSAPCSRRSTSSRLRPVATPPFDLARSPLDARRHARRVWPTPRDEVAVAGVPGGRDHARPGAEIVARVLEAHRVEPVERARPAAWKIDRVARGPRPAVRWCAREATCGAPSLRGALLPWVDRLAGRVAVVWGTSSSTSTGAACRGACRARRRS